VASEQTEAQVKDEKLDPQVQGTNGGLADIEEPFVDGFTWNTIAAMIFIGVVMMPGAILLGLVAGQAMSGAAEWVTIILFLEIARRSFVTIRRQEIIVIYWAAAMLVAPAANAIVGGQFATMIWNQYLIQSPQAEAIAEFIPTWVVPPKGSEPLLERTFLHSFWIKPFIVAVATWFFFMVNQLSLGYVIFRITSDIERLPFPMAPIAAEGATALAESSSKSESWRWRLFSIGTVIGLIWGTIYIVIPTLSSTFLTETVTILPIPFIDFTVNLRAVLPTAVLVINTEISGLLVGMVIPFWAIVGNFIGAMIKNFVMNPAFFHYGLLERWEPGMSFIPTTLAVNFDFWLSAKIGMAFTIFIISMAAIVKALMRGSMEISDTAEDQQFQNQTGPGSGRGDVPIWMALAAFVVASGCMIVFIHWLVPEFPWWILCLFAFVLTPMMSYVAAKMTGITGTTGGAQFPYVREGAIYLSGYQGVDIWFAPMPIGDYSALATTFRVMQLTRTKFISYVKLIAVNFIIVLIASFVFWSFIWKMTAIPSSAYPYAQKMWPFHATIQVLWASSTLPGGSNLMRGIVTLPKILSGVGIASISYAIVMLVKGPLSLFYGLMQGFAGFPMGQYLLLTGALLSRFYFGKRFGHDTWRRYATLLVAGYGCGMGLIAMTSIAVSLVMKSISSVVF
jgi:hypothetical protein